MLNKRVRALLFADITWFFGEGMLGPLFAVFTERIGGDILNITSAWAAYLIVSGLLIIAIGKFSDHKLNKKQLLFWGFVLNAILTFCYLFVKTPFQLLILQMGLGVANAMATPTWDALYAEYENRKQSGLTWGLADGLSEFCIGLAIIIGGLIVVNFSFEMLFIIMGIIQVISVILLLPIHRKDV
jgi:predicted MFS family arabinose efflux permease